MARRVSPLLPRARVVLAATVNATSGLVTDGRRRLSNLIRPAELPEEVGYRRAGESIDLGVLASRLQADRLEREAAEREADNTRQRRNGEFHPGRIVEIHAEE